MPRSENPKNPLRSEEIILEVLQIPRKNNWGSYLSCLDQLAPSRWAFSNKILPDQIVLVISLDPTGRL